MAIDFPASPTNGQQFTPIAGLSYVYNGYAWDLVSGGVSNAAFHAMLSADQTGVANETFTKVAFNTASFNIGGYYNTSTQRWVPPVGVGNIIAAVYFSAGLLLGTPIQIALYKNGTIFKREFCSASADYGSASISVVDNANGSDYYEVYVNVMSGATATISSGASYTYFQAR